MIKDTIKEIVVAIITFGISLIVKTVKEKKCKAIKEQVNVESISEY